MALRRAWLALVALALIAAAGFWVYERSFAQGASSLKAASNGRLDLFASVVEARVRRLEPVPATIQLNPVVVRLLQAPSAAHALAANDYLSRLNAHLGSLAVFVLDVRGVVLASSNTALRDDSLRGEDVSYRPYYLEALAGRSTRHFAIGSGGHAGYFASHPIYDGPRVVGVAVIKIGLDALEQTWPMLGAPALVADANQVVILSSQPQWRYTSLAPLPTERRVDLQLAQTYGALRLPLFPLSVELSVNEDSQEVQGLLRGDEARVSAALGQARSRADFMVLGRSLDGMDWRVLIFTSLAAVRHQALLDGVGGAVSVAFLLLLALYWAQRQRIERQKLGAKRQLEQANAELEQEVGRRTQELTDANTLLRKEVAEREQTEKTLRAAQNELVHAGKMAVLGQLAASITHELTQPLGGIRTLSGNAAEFMRRGNHGAAQENLSIVARLVDQMARIIDPLKSFSRKSSSRPEATDVGRIVEQALFLFQLRLRHEKVETDNRCEPGRWIAWCDANRLEQVLVNLVGNALDAMRDAPRKTLRITAELRPEQEQVPPVIAIQVQDSGKGLSEADFAHLFEPFYTTKASGAGLGLGLVICRDIAAEFQGALQAHNVPEGGACFTLTVPLWQASLHPKTPVTP
ncbi:MAG: ATP-binding protein [Hydrogenophaga sp.]|uniref:ATP-binding protein n=1 Tax=Hydrogenophaga sp. TaxID=1904254 RepID=UPI0027287C82|nr:ATP-binding protein [Hydrogenophaga sp.]MDO9031447.1 ATP-binding protein [Hydrogenophaga sp.]